MTLIKGAGGLREGSMEPSQNVMKIFNRLVSIICVLCIVISLHEDDEVIAKSSIQNIKLTTTSKVKVNPSFGDYTSLVDENIYYSLAVVNRDAVIQVYGKYDTPMFNMLCDTVNPCMALATTWGEAGVSYPGISMTTVSDFTPSTYKDIIDWYSVSQNLDMINADWYYVNAQANYNTNELGKAYHIPTKLLQNYDSTGALTGLGVGPYQITSSDWNTWILDRRVAPVSGFRDSLKKCGTSWINCGIVPISDITVYACLSLGHQGGALINYDFGYNLIDTINQPYVQDALLEVGYQMYQDVKDKSYNKEVSLSDINVSKYNAMVKEKTGITFSSFNGSGVGPTNKGNYVLNHTLRYIFYKYYFTDGGTYVK